MVVFFVLKLRGENSRGREFDYKREADGSTPVSEANERLCNSSASAEYTLSAHQLKQKTAFTVVFLC